MVPTMGHGSKAKHDALDRGLLLDNFVPELPHNQPRVYGLGFRVQGLEFRA